MPWEELRCPRDEASYFYFTLPPAAERWDSLRALLTREEQERASRFVKTADRERSVGGRGAARHLLGLWAGVPAKDIELTQTELGRPVLVGGPEFSVSHSGSGVLIGVNPAGRVGVDIEEFKTGDSDFMRSVMTARERTLDDGMPVEERLAFRYLLWTRKEAALKAVGLGLQMDPASLDVLGSCLLSGLGLTSFQLSGTMPGAIADEGGLPRQFIRVTW